MALSGPATQSEEMTEMIQMAGPDHRLARGLLDANGGFVWWYLDLIDEAGNGLVLIWSYGLPFLPGYAKAARRGDAPAPRDRPSLNVAIYTRGELDCYLLQEYRADAAHWSHDGDHWKMGENEMATAVENGRRRLEIYLDAPVPGTRERLQGKIEVEGPARQPDDEPATHEDGELPIHDWSPLTGPARGEADFRVGSTIYGIQGRAYFDRNGGARPQHDLGMDHWLWGRVPLPDRERIYYLLWPKGADEPITLGVDIHDDGRTRTDHDLTVDTSAHRKGIAGLSYWKHLKIERAGEPWLDVEHTSVVDDGPFYMRFQAQGTTPDSSALGMAELCYPDRVDRDLHRPLVRMRVHEVGGRNSMWLPLFTGPRQGRVSRLVKNLWGAP